jgi:hypothetical protein
MANGHGGARTPAQPAPVSGPGALAQRTDGGPAAAQYVSGLPYGDGQDFYDLQTSAPLGAEAAKTQMRSGAQATQGGPSMSATPLFAPTARPDEPVTAGAPFGPGESAAPQPGPRRSLAETLQMLAQYDQSGEVARLAQAASRRGW